MLWHFSKEGKRALTNESAYSAFLKKAREPLLKKAYKAFDMIRFIRAMNPAVSSTSMPSKILA